MGDCRFLAHLPGGRREIVDFWPISQVGDGRKERLMASPKQEMGDKDDSSQKSLLLRMRCEYELVTSTRYADR